jgi:predicted membrane protein
VVFKRNYLLPIFLVLQIVFLNVLSFFPEWVERWYSNGWYVVISKLSRTVLGRIPFSVGDILYGIVIVYLLLQVWKTRKLWKKNWKDFVLKTLSFISLVVGAELLSCPIV